jgi:hypothetical protein
MLTRVPQIDLIEETYIAAAPALVATAVGASAFTDRLWPDLALTVFMDRGEAGIRWTATGALVGSCEIWLEPHGDGVIVHTYLRTDPTASGSGTEPATLAPRAVLREVRRRARHAKAELWRLKDTLEAGRRPGEPAATGRV